MSTYRRRQSHVPFEVMKKDGGGALNSLLMALLILAWTVSLIAALVALGAVLGMST